MNSSKPWKNVRRFFNKSIPLNNIRYWTLGWKHFMYILKQEKVCYLESNINIILALSILNVQSESQTCLLILARNSPVASDGLPRLCSWIAVYTQQQGRNMLNSCICSWHDCPYYLTKVIISCIRQLYYYYICCCCLRSYRLRTYCDDAKYYYYNIK